MALPKYDIYYHSCFTAVYDYIWHTVVRLILKIRRGMWIYVISQFIGLHKLKKLSTGKVISPFVINCNFLRQQLMDGVPMFYDGVNWSGEFNKGCCVTWQGLNDDGSIHSIL